MLGTLFGHDSTNPTKVSLVALILRVGLAVIFLIHGLDKIVNGDGGTSWVDHMYAGQPEVTHHKPEAARSQTLQLPATVTFSGTQLVVAWGEFLAGLALAIGLLTRWAALGLIVIQIGAVCVVTAPRGFYFERGGGYEYNLALLAMCLSILILGAGIWSVDRWLAQQRHARRHGTMATTASPLAGPHAVSGQPTEQLSPGQHQTM
mgnify:CR=1 FL=1